MWTLIAESECARQIYRERERESKIERRRIFLALVEAYDQTTAAIPLYI